jgi:hypothetical protein
MTLLEPPASSRVGGTVAKQDVGPDHDHAIRGFVPGAMRADRAVGRYLVVVEEPYDVT